uniref:Uncharacterized protein n=1 Tax=Lepeophtheirus salmonis TaxID=72036 RepID=A0A0K2THP3_LEPSM
MDGSYQHHHQRAYFNSHFVNAWDFLRGPWKQPSLTTTTTHASGNYEYLNCANGRMTPVNVTYDRESHILDAYPTPAKVFRLNPDAKSFVPMHCLNPYAREFKPKSFQEENLRHKRSCISNNSSEEDDISSGDDIILPPQKETLPDKDDNRIISNLVELSSSLPTKKMDGPNEKKEVCDKLKICTLGSDDSCDEDDDWDDLEFGSPESPSAWGDLPEEFKDNFGLTYPISQKPEARTSQSNTSRVKEFLLSANSEDSDSDEDSNNEEDIRREKELHERLAAINIEWSKHYLNPSNNSNDDCIKKNVSFSQEDCWSVIEEDPKLAKELRESRISDHLSRKADRERLEKIISPILDEDHRKKVYLRVYSEFL